MSFPPFCRSRKACPRGNGGRERESSWSLKFKQDWHNYQRFSSRSLNIRVSGALL
ncbi:MAG: hypothetical protein OXJ52_03800 [Oligoflexia bacterium]|nr:hypothetical protein [Oligoflexia bacterium]